MSSLFDVLSHLPFPADSEHPGIKMRITLGFFDPQTSYFQTKIPQDLFSSMDVSARGIKTTPAGHTESFRGFEKHFRVAGSPFDLKIQFVQAERQAVFVHEPSGSVQAICAQEFLRPMTAALETLLMSVSDEHEVHFRAF
jgi:hypothetical protein